MPRTTKPITVSLPDDLLKYADQRRQKLGYTRSMLIQQLLRADKRATEKRQAAEAKQAKG